MLGLTADIAENLLSLKDSGSDILPDDLKIKIISLAELAAAPSLPVAEEEPEESSALLDYDNGDNEEESEEEHEHEHQHEQEHSAEQAAKPKSKPKSETDSETGTEGSATEGSTTEENAEDHIDTVIPVDETAEEAYDLEAMGDATEDEFVQIAEAEPIEESTAPIPVQFSESPVSEKSDYITDHIDEPIVENDTAQDETDHPTADDEMEELPADDEEIPPDTEVDSTVQQEVTSAQQPEAEYGVTDAVTLRKSFSINDAFLFRREIFGGSDESFNNALVYISHLSTKRQLQEFLVEELSLNLNEYPGKDFYTILLKFFQ